MSTWDTTPVPDCRYRMLTAAEKKALVTAVSVLKRVIEEHRFREYGKYDTCRREG